MSRCFALEAEGLMDLETDNPVAGSENQTALESLGCFGALASSGAAVPPSSSPLMAVDASTNDAVSNLNSFMTEVSALKNMVTTSTPAGKEEGEHFTSLSAASYTSPLAPGKPALLAPEEKGDLGVHLLHYREETTFAWVESPTT